MRHGRAARPRRFCTRIRAVAGQICWHLCGKNSMAAAQRNGPQKLAGSLQPDRCQKSRRSMEPFRCPFFLQIVLSLTWNYRNLAQNPWRSSRDDIALYPGTFGESVWASSCVLSKGQLGYFQLGKSKPQGISAIFPVLAVKRGR